MSRTPAPPAKHTDAAPRRVSHRHDATERQADRAADIVARGGSVTGWSFANVPAEASVHRDEDEPKKLEDKPREQGEAYKEAAGKAIERGVESELPSGKKVREVIEETPPLAAAAVGGLALAGKDVPVSGFPGVKDVVPPGVSIGLRAEGLPGLLSGDPRPGGGPTRFSDLGVGLTFGYTEQLPKGGRKRQSAAEKKSAAIAADTARLKNDPIIKRLNAQQDKELSDAAIASVVARQKFAPAGQVPGLPFPLVPPILPTRPLDEPQAEQQKKPEDAVKAEEQKKREEVQRAPATTSEATPAHEFDTSGVDAATRGGGRALDPGLRHSMEARFGYDFSSVRLHDDPQAASAAAGVDATAFTVGEHIVFGSGRFDPSSPEGRHLIAHELAHVVQQRGGAAPRSTGAPARVQRRSFWERLAVFFGAEGTWTDAELQAYLKAITKAAAHDGSYDADNKARAVVQKWKAGTPGWELTGKQMGLLIDEMVDGPTLDDDEDAILDLVELATPDELLVVFREPAKRYASLDDNLHGAQQDRLDDFVSRRFAGGGKALARGTAEVVGPDLPAGSPSFAFDAARFDARFEEDYYGSDPASLVARLSPADRTKARDHVLRTTRPRWNGELAAVTRKRVAATDETERDELATKERKLRRRVRALDLFIADTLHRDLPASPDDALAATSPVTGDDAKAARAALTPPLPAKPKPAVTPPTSATPPATAPPTGAPKPKQSAAERRKEAAARKKEEAARKKAEAEQKAKEEAERKAMFAPGGKYRTLVAAALTAKIEKAYESARATGTAAKPSEIERMAKPAKDATDGVFGGFYDAGARPELTFGADGRPQTLFSWHDRQTTAVKSAAPGDRVRWALQQIRYYFRSDAAFDAINAECDARPETIGEKRNDEAQALEDVAQAAVVDGVSATWEDDPQTTADKLIYIDRNWGGAQVGWQIYVDMFQTGEVDEDRAARWEMFQTLVHEYGHTLAHKDYRQYASKLKEKSEREWNTLMEGVDSLLTDVVWSKSGRRLMAHRPTRELVEGKSWAALPPVALGPPSAYASITEAQRLLDVVGADNVWTAYFLGKVDRIGGTSGGSRS